MSRQTQYLHLYNVFTVTDTEANLGTGKTITAFFATSRASNATAIASTTKTATASGGSYTLSYTRSELQTALTAYVNQTVYLHLDDGVGAHDTWPFTPTLIDPDLL